MIGVDAGALVHIVADAVPWGRRCGTGWRRNGWLPLRVSRVPFVTTDARIHRSGQGRCKIEMFCEQTIGT